MKPSINNKCTWTASIAAVAVALCITASTTVGGGPPANFGAAFISNVAAVNGECVQSNTNGGGIQFWDIQAGGTYDVTLSGVTDCANQGNDSTIQVIVHNTTGGNICATATQTAVGVYTFRVALTTQCLTMPIEYCTSNCNPGTTGPPMFAQDDIGGAPGGHQGHLRTSLFDSSCNRTGDDTTCQVVTPPKGALTV